jgi:hypothetical protein
MLHDCERAVTFLVTKHRFFIALDGCCLIELYKKYMVDLGKDNIYEKAEITDQEYGALEGETHTRRKEKALPGEHSAAGQRVHGIRRRTRKYKDNERASDENEEV